MTEIFEIANKDFSPAVVERGLTGARSHWNGGEENLVTSKNEEEKKVKGIVRMIFNKD